MAILVQELNVGDNTTPRGLLNRIVTTASRGPAGINQAARGLRKLVATEAGSALVKQMLKQFAILNNSGTPVTAKWNFENAWPVKVTGPSPKSDGNSFGLDEFAYAKRTTWTDAKATYLVRACIGIKGSNRTFGLRR